MAYIFSYGSLQKSSVQQAVFGKKLKGFSDNLTGFRISKQKAYGSYPILVEIGNKADKISGVAYEIEDSQMELADAYEGPEYQRISVGLESGKKAWLYVGL